MSLVNEKSLGTQEGKATCPSCTAGIWQSWGVTPGSWPESLLLSLVVLHVAVRKRGDNSHLVQSQHPNKIGLELGGRMFFKALDRAPWGLGWGFMYTDKRQM